MTMIHRNEVNIVQLIKLYTWKLLYLNYSFVIKLFKTDNFIWCTQIINTFNIFHNMHSNKGTLDFLKIMKQILKLKKNIEAMFPRCE